MGKLQELGKKLEESNKKMEAAQKSGDQNAQAAAAIEGLGTLLGGGKHVDPIAIDQLKPFVPESFAGLPKTASSAEKTGIAGLMVSKAEARYGDGAAKSVTLEISDTGGVSGLMGLASWAGVEGEKDDDSGSEKTQKVGGRLVHERSVEERRHQRVRPRARRSFRREREGQRRRRQRAQGGDFRPRSRASSNR